MGSFVESSNCYEMPFRTSTKYEIFPPGTSDTVIIDTLAKSNISHIQATRAPTEEDIAILNEIFRRNPNIAFRIYSLSPEKVDLAILSRLTNLKLLYLDFWPKVDNIEVVQKLDLDYLSLSCFQVKDYSFLKNVSSTLKGLTVFLEDKTYKMDINYILHMTELERLGLRNVKRGLDKLNEFKNLEELSLRSTSITDYSFLKEMNVKKLYLAMQNAEYFNTFGNCESIEEIKIWANFSEDENGDIYCEIRSNGANINVVATKYGGGGHLQASGTTIYGFDTVKDIISDLEKVARGEECL